MNRIMLAIRSGTPFVIVVLGASVALGCAFDTEPEEKSIAETEQAFGRWFASWGTTNGPDLDLGSDTNKTCFLAGVAGNLSVGVYAGSSNPRAEARVYRSGGKYWLRARANQYGTGTTPVTARAVCVNWTAGRTGEFLWTSSGAWETEFPGTAGKECFFTGLSGQSGTWDGDDYALLVRPSSGQNWKLRAQVPGEGFFFVTTAHVRTVCLNRPSGVEAREVDGYGGKWLSVLYDTAGAACGLTGVVGQFDTNSWDDGALLYWPNSLPGWWSFRVKHLTRADGTCLR